MLDDMRTPREREILVGLTLDDGKGTQIRRELGWSHWQFNRVIVGARRRLSTLIDEAAGFGREAPL